jgi:hypothetical protein
MNHRFNTIAFTLSLVLAAPTVAEEFHQEGAHVHGEARLDLVLEGNTLSATLESPAINLVGFEHPPRTPDEHAQLDTAQARLRDGAGMLGLPAEAGCRQTRFALASALLEEKGHDHAHEGGRKQETGHDSHDHEGHDHAKHDHAAEHADFDVNWEFACDRPEAFQRIQPGLFGAFPGLEGLQVQWMGPKGQKGAGLSPAKPALDL